MHTLQEELGYLKDIVTLNSILERFLERSGGAKAKRAAGFLIGWYEREVVSGYARLARYGNGSKNRHRFAIELHACYFTEISLILKN